MNDTDNEWLDLRIAQRLEQSSGLHRNASIGAVMWSI
jgi:hypothetical protein